MKNVISAKRSFYYNWLCDLPEVQLRTMLAFVNHLCWVAADRSKLIRKRANGKTTVLGSAQKLKLNKVVCATTGMSKYVRKFWQKASYSRPSLIKVRKEFQEMGLLDVMPRKFNDNRHFATVYVNLKIADLLIVAEMIEELLCDRAYARKEVSRKNNLDTLPKHKGYGAVMLFNQVFKGVAKWRRKIDEMVLWAEASEIELELFDIMFQPDACCLGW